MTNSGIDTVAPSPSFGKSLVGSEITEYLRSMITSGALHAGDRLRVEHLAALMKVSVTPVRESLVELAGEGFVVRRPRRGYVVATVTPDGLRDRVLVLAMITGELAARAAERISDDDVAALEILQRELSSVDAAGRRLEAEALNHRLHSDINIAADSPELAWMAQRGTRYVPKVTWVTTEQIPRTCSYQHGEVIAALRAHDATAGRRAMHDHLVESGELLAADLEGKLWPSTSEGAGAR